MKYYQETRLFDDYEFKLRALYESEKQVFLTSSKLSLENHINRYQYSDIIKETFTSHNVCHCQDMLLDLLRAIINGEQDPEGRREIWMSVIFSIPHHKEIRGELLQALNALPQEPMFSIKKQL